MRYSEVPGGLVPLRAPTFLPGEASVDAEAGKGSPTDSSSSLKLDLGAPQVSGAEWVKQARRVRRPLRQPADHGFFWVLCIFIEWEGTLILSSPVCKHVM